MLVSRTSLVIITAVLVVNTGCGSGGNTDATSSSGGRGGDGGGDGGQGGDGGKGGYGGQGGQGGDGGQGGGGGQGGDGGQGGGGGQGGAMATCGDSIQQMGEDCDDGGESATCNVDCTKASCGDGKINATAGEACDLGAENGASSVCCTASCGLAVGTVCRAGSGDACDPDETCDGDNTACPADLVSDATVPCRAGSGDICDPDELCTGVPGAACPADVINGGVACSAVACGNPAAVCSGVAGEGCPGCEVLPAINGLKVTILESTSVNPGQTMDSIWSTIATGLGLVPAIVPQTTLDNQAFFATTDILIVSSGTVPLTVARGDTVRDFLMAGGAIYLQGEFQDTYSTNVAFKKIIEDMGGTFTWMGSLNGDLAPVIPLGCLQSSNTCVPQLNYHWYAATGTGSAPGLSTFMEKNGAPIAFTYYPPGLGRLIFTTDQDWILQSSAHAGHHDLMTNILLRLGNP